MNKAQQLAEEEYPSNGIFGYEYLEICKQRAAFIAGYDAGKQAKIKDIEQADTTVFDSIVQEADKWIKVEDAPKEDGVYLVHLSNGQNYTGFYSVVGKAWMGFYLIEITHWQPIEPPKTK
jgi:hypothetical protein